MINGSPTTGYGYTIVIDHQNDFYTLYAHLAINASSGLVTLGQAVSQGDVIGYLANDEKSSGNVLSEVVAPVTRFSFTLSASRRHQVAVRPVRLRTSRTDVHCTTLPHALRRLAINRSSVWSRELLRKPQTTRQMPSTACHWTRAEWYSVSRSPSFGKRGSCTACLV